MLQKRKKKSGGLEEEKKKGEMERRRENRTNSPSTKKNPPFSLCSLSSLLSFPSGPSVLLLSRFSPPPLFGFPSSSSEEIYLSIYWRTAKKVQPLNKYSY